MTRALVLYAHPCEESYASALHECVVKTLTARGWDVDDCDLYAEDFQPVLTAKERREYHDIGANEAPVADYVARLKAADALILVNPVWNFGFPAILKGFLDRVFLPGVSFRLEDGSVKPNLTNIKTLASVTTYGATHWRATLAGNPPKRCVARMLRHICQAKTFSYQALYDMNNASDAKRAAFLKAVEKKMEVL